MRRMLAPMRFLLATRLFLLYYVFLIYFGVFYRFRCGSYQSYACYGYDRSNHRWRLGWLCLHSAGGQSHHVFSIGP